MNQKVLLFRLVSVFFFLLPGIAGAQIPNSGFENWTAQDPDGWLTTNNPPTIVNITQSSDAHSGSKAVQGAVVSIAGFPVAPILVSGSGSHGFPYTGRPGALHGFYKYTPSGSDRFQVSAALALNGSPVAAALFSTTSPSGSVYREFVANFAFGSSATPDTAYITFSITNSPSPHTGSVFLIDDLTFGTATRVAEVESPQAFHLDQNYPNPFNPSTNIAFQIPSTGLVSLKVHDLLGREVATLINEELQPGSYKATFDGKGLSSGIYFYTLRAGHFLETRRLVLLK